MGLVYVGGDDAVAIVKWRVAKALTCDMHNYTHVRMCTISINLIICLGQ